MQAFDQITTDAYMRKAVNLLQKTPSLTIREKKDNGESELV